MVHNRIQGFLERLILAINERLGLFWVSVGWQEQDGGAYERHRQEIMTERKIASIIHDALQIRLNALIRSGCPKSMLAPARKAVNEYRDLVFQEYFSPEDERRLQEVAWGALENAGNLYRAWRIPH